MTFFDSNFIFTAPVRKYKANDPYYWEVDNIPVQQLEENCLWLKDQVENLATGGGSESMMGGGGGQGAGSEGTSFANVTRANFSDLKPSVAGSKITVNPGRFTARINDAATLTEPLSQPALNAGVNYQGEGTTWIMRNPAAVRSAVDKIFSTAGANALHLNGLFEQFSDYAVYKVGLGQYVNTGSTVTSTNLNDNLSYTGFPLVDHEKVYDALNNIFTFTLNNTAYDQPLATEFTKRWRGVARTAVVDVPEALELTVPDFSDEDFFYVDGNGATQLIGGTSQRIDLIFLYTKPIDQGSSKIISNGGVATTTTAKLGILVGAGLGLNFNTNTTGEYATIVKNNVSPTTADAYMLPSKADIASNEGGVLLKDGTTITGSFPAPDDILNLAPLLANDLATNDFRLVGQTVLPLAYVVVTAAQAGTIPSSHLVDIRPFFRTTELTYDERAGIAAALPGLSLANPAVGKRELDDHIHGAITAALGTGGGTGDPPAPPLVPRPVGGGYIWGGTKWGPEGAITAAYSGDSDWLGNGIVGMSYANVPANPDWDWSTWSQYLDGTEDGAGLHKNDWMNFKYTINRNMSTDSTLDFQEAGASLDEAIFTNSFGTGIGKGSTGGADGDPSPLMMYWVKKRFSFSLPNGYSNYCVKAALSNCVALSQGGFGRNSTRDFESGGTDGIWITKGAGWFEINVGWVGPDPYQEQGEQWAGWNSDSVKACSFPSSNRDSSKFRSWAALHTGLPATTVAAGNNANDSDGTAATGFVPALDSATTTKCDQVGVCTYPTVVFEVTAFPSGWENDGFLLYNSNMPHDGTTTLVLK